MAGLVVVVDCLTGCQVSRDELDWSTNELRNCLRAIDWDLEDLSETINILRMVHMVL